eukprot:tig00020904_g15223.t1
MSLRFLAPFRGVAASFVAPRRDTHSIPGAVTLRWARSVTIAPWPVPALLWRGHRPASSPVRGYAAGPVSHGPPKPAAGAAAAQAAPAKAEEDEDDITEDDDLLEDEEDEDDDDDAPPVHTKKPEKPAGQPREMDKKPKFAARKLKVDDSDRPPMNREIRAAKVMLVDPTGASKGVVAIADALAQAKEVEEDLVQVGMSGEGVPVCKIMDYAKSVYERERRERKQKAAGGKEMKSVAFTEKSDQHDIARKIDTCKRFLEKGHPVKIQIKPAAQSVAAVGGTRQLLLLVVRELHGVGTADLSDKAALTQRMPVAVVAPRQAGASAGEPLPTLPDLPEAQRPPQFQQHHKPGHRPGQNKGSQQHRGAKPRPKK